MSMESIVVATSLIVGVTFTKKAKGHYKTDFKRFMKTSEKVTHLQNGYNKEDLLGIWKEATLLLMRG